MSELRVSVIGAGGGIARKRAGHFAGNPRSAFMACASRTFSKAKSLAEEHGARAFETWHELVADPEINAVCIATPNTTHFEIAKGALENGKHTLVEYPLCQTLEEINELKALADAKGVKLHHGLNTQSEPLFLKTLENLPKIGEIGYAHVGYFQSSKWYSTPALVGNRFLALHIHYIDYYRGWFGKCKSLVATVHDGGVGESHPLGGSVLMEMERCPAAYIEWGMGYPGWKEYSFRIVGLDGAIEKAEKLRVVRGDEVMEIEQPANNALELDSENFVAEVLDGAAPLRSWEDNVRTLQLCLDCMRSAETGEKIFY